MNARAALAVGTAVVTLIAGALPAVAGSRKEESRKSTTAAPPMNDGFAAGTEVAEMPFANTVDMSRASLELSEPQPSCSTAMATVWYRFTAQDDLNMVATSSAVFPTGITVYTGSDLGALSEVTCAGASPESHAAFPASAGSVYFLQIAAGKRHKGFSDFSLKVDPWNNRELASQEFVVPVPMIDQAAVVIDGKPREMNPKIYDLTITAGENTVGPYGIETDPVVLPAIHQELVKVPGQNVTVTLTSTYRYDSAQRKCVLYQGEECVKALPLSGSPSWYTGGEGAQAELVVTLRITHNDQLLAQRTVTAPFAGQIGGLLP